MRTVNVEDLSAGLTLARDVLAPNGRLLTPEGTVLTPKHIRIFKAWGVTEVDISGRSANLGQACSSQALKESGEALKPYFQLANTRHPAVRELFKQAVMSRAMSKEQPGTDDRPRLDHDLGRDVPQPGPPASRQEFLDQIKSETALISLPDIYVKIMDVLESPRCSARHVAEVVSKDSGLAARLLRLVNSPFYGFSTKVDTVSRAITLLGIDKLTTLAQGIAVVRAFDSIATDLLDMEKFWKHSIACGVYARLLASQKPELSEERFFVAGLLHDLGRLVLIKRWPELFAQALDICLKEKMFLHQAEKRVFGLDHTRVAGMLCAQWHFPQSLEIMIEAHHNPGASHHVFESTVIHVADIMAHAMGVGTSGNAFVPALCDTGWRALDLSPGVLTTVTVQARHQLADILQTFLSPGTDHG